MLKIIIFILLYTINCHAQEIEKEDWITDLNFLKSELSKKHKNLFSKISENTFENEIQKIINDLDKDTDSETSIKLMQLIAKVGDSHTTITISHIIGNRKIIPLDLIWFKEGLFILGTSKENHTILDKQIVSINGFKTETILDSLKTLFVHENTALIKNNTALLLDNNALLKHFGFSKENDSIYDLGLKDIDGQTMTYSLGEVNYGVNYSRNKVYMKVNTSKPFYLNGSGKSFKDEYFPKEKIYFIQYNKCISKETVERYGDKKIASKFESFDDFEKDVIKKLETLEIDKLIFDMRFNQGGSSYLAESLIDKIASNKKINIKGKLFVVVGNATFSSAIFNTIYFKNNTKATIIGEETAGKPNHFGYVKSFTLPYSRIKVNYSSEYWKLTDEDTSTVTPDKKVERRYYDYKNGIDPIFDFVKNFKSY